MNKKRIGKIVAGTAAAGALLLAYRVFGWDSMGAVNSLQLDLSKPDALVVTRSLSTLPRDLLTIPLARDVLREEFLFYYEQSEDRLGLKGSLRRIAYEHELGWGDQLLRMVLDQPAEVALWRDGDGSLKHYAIAVSRDQLARVLAEAGKVALKDSQLTLAGELEVEGSDVPVYALQTTPRSTLLFAAHGRRMVILSHPGMLFGQATQPPKPGPADKDAARIVAGLLGAAPAGQQVFHAQFKFAPQRALEHSVAVKADFLSFGYQPFFGALQALRFDFSKGRWQSQVLLDGARLAPGGYDSSALWAALPHNPSACFTLPVDWAAMQPVLGRFNDDTLAEQLPAQLSGPAAACWYADSRLHTPVFVATRGAGAQATQMFGDLFAAAIPKAASAGAANGAATEWRAQVPTGLGAATPTLAVQDRTVVFSADAKLVERVLAVRRKQAAAISDLLPDAGRTVGMIAPGALAGLIQLEAFDSLPANDEPVLRAAADEHLVPRLQALRKYPPYRMVLTQAPSKGLAWQPLEWQPIKR